MTIPQTDWIWQGFPGHFIGARECRFRLCTVVGNAIISTVGAYAPRSSSGEYQKIGCRRLYETFVFPAGQPDEYSGEICPLTGSEIDSLPANTPTEARENHLAMCRRWSTPEKQSEAVP